MWVKQDLPRGPVCQQQCQELNLFLFELLVLSLTNYPIYLLNTYFLKYDCIRVVTLLHAGGAMRGVEQRNKISFF